MLGKSALEIATNHLLIDCIESYMKSPCTLAEANAVLINQLHMNILDYMLIFGTGWKKNP